MKLNLILNKKSPNSKQNFCFDPLPYSSNLSRVNVYLTFRMLLYFRISNSVMLSSDNGNILIFGFSFQGTVLNVFFSVFNVIRYNSNGIL